MRAGFALPSQQPLYLLIIIHKIVLLLTWLNSNFFICSLHLVKQLTVSLSPKGIIKFKLAEYRHKNNMVVDCSL